MLVRWSRGSSTGIGACGIAWRDVPLMFGPWQTIWTWHHRLAKNATWGQVLARLLAAADSAGLIDWSVSADSTIVRAHQHATHITCPTVDGIGAGRTTRICEASPLDHAIGRW
jgi:putative transposase